MLRPLDQYRKKERHNEPQQCQNRQTRGGGLNAQKEKNAVTDPIHIVFAADPGYYRHLCVTLVSILENNSDLYIHAHVLTNHRSDKAEAPLKSLESKYNLVLDFQVVDDSQFSRLKLTIDYISIQTYYRYILAWIFPDLDKVLYLDCDIVVRGSIKELWTENLDGYCAAGVFDPYVNNGQWTSLLNRIGFQGRNDYVNAGVLLFNLKAIRENALIDDFFSCQEAYENAIQFQDQDVINIVLKGQIKLLPPQFNWFYGQKHIEPIIVHYTGKVKPWSLRKGYDHVYKNEYFKYLRRTPYAYHCYYYSMVSGYRSMVPMCRKICDFIFSMKTNQSAFRIKIFGIRIYKKTNSEPLRTTEP
jgi:lipopolysaccharide biosynthesis glycosyltransferase